MLCAWPRLACLLGLPSLHRLSAWNTRFAWSLLWLTALQSLNKCKLYLVVNQMQREFGKTECKGISYQLFWLTNLNAVFIMAQDKRGVKSLFS
jgi:hypothetical protein